MTSSRVAVVVPAYNESQHIEQTLLTIPDWVDHIVVVDDASRDDTARRARNVPRAVTVIQHRNNQGVGAALRTGCAAALLAGADVLAVMAGDGQMDPAELSKVVAPVLRGDADFCKGNRMPHPTRVHVMPRTRQVAIRVLSFLTRMATGFSVGDSQCGYLSLSRSAVFALHFSTLWPRYGYPNDLLVRAARAKLRVTEVVVRPIYGNETSGLRWWHGLFVVPFVLLRAVVSVEGVCARRHPDDEFSAA